MTIVRVFAANRPFDVDADLATAIAAVNDKLGVRAVHYDVEAIGNEVFITPKYRRTVDLLNLAEELKQNLTGPPVDQSA